MDPSEPPPAPAYPSGPPEAKKPGGVVPLAAGFFFLFLEALSSPNWQIGLIAFLFSFTGLICARGMIQRVLGVFLSGIAGALCLISCLIRYWAPF